MGKEKKPYILIEKALYNLFLGDPFLQSVNNQIINIRETQLPEKFIKAGDALIPIFSEKVERLLSELEDLKNRYVETHYAVKE